MNTDALQSVLEVSVLLFSMGAAVGLGIVVLRIWAESQTPRESLSDRINSLLPQIQCAKCGYPGCKPYAEALVNGERLDLCPPGGETLALNLSNLLNRPVTPTVEEFQNEAVAIIEEEKCIGCALCINACPVDAIVGAERFMHTVVKQHCTGCELCVPVCPVDCIDMVNHASTR